MLSITNSTMNSISFSINLSPFSPPAPPPRSYSCSCSYSLCSSLSFVPRRSLPLLSRHPLKQRELLASNTMISGEVNEEEEVPPLLDDAELNSRPRRIALFVEPSPFAYVSGYKNRFQNFIKNLREMGDEVIVVTTHEGVPQEFYGAKLIGSWSYIPRYTFSWLVKPMWMIIKFLHRAADLTLVPSAAISKDLLAARVTAANKIRLWNKGVDSESFHPRYCSHEMRVRLSAGETEKPLLIHVGRLGVEKSLDFLKRVMDRLPGVRIAFIGDGPYRNELEKIFAGMPAVFTGMLLGEELSQAYASGDIFLMPSESETLGLVVLEAMASGVPVVAARAGGIPDIIPEEQEGKTSILYTPGDLDDCVSKLEQLLSNDEFRLAMGKAAREEMEKYDWRAATRKIRNEQYNAAIWFWRKKRAQLLRPIQWLARRIFRSPAITYT
ncbi:N-acetylglucosaminyltransferase complex subunit PIG-A/SPT14 required for phosphatidylinositol biosynthesis/Sulfolipid synthase protein [Dioscorea alata]|uniref:N-acetylglucosaminyltransferase complex subunit PIG-A/SPT14 required for phosphatidylinositol biosynthesis/Sulfolipid synthase protein n=1 Tax=Dioscorea alata TaxID=55571 RepID=A0ACB7VGK7_DIOAL|nr:N-acetylglucosaminyltransferase complex subunit PIG-A/SPT14 required for phosphatidylinositol biosynthesis/Sulfolipid synthase protein [Dioscorea alata]